jgi:hypothetical protein
MGKTHLSTVCHLRNIVHNDKGEFGLEIHEKFTQIFPLRIVPQTDMYISTEMIDLGWGTHYHIQLRN